MFTTDRNQKWICRVVRLACCELFLFFGIGISVVFATSGCCSGHGGVNCGAGPQSNGHVVCNDGSTGSSCSYSSMVECGGATSGGSTATATTAPTPIPTPLPPTSTPKPVQHIVQPVVTSAPTHVVIATPLPTPTPTDEPTLTPDPTLTPTPVPATATPSPTPTPSPQTQSSNTDGKSGAFIFGLLSGVGGTLFFNKKKTKVKKEETGVKLP